MAITALHTAATGLSALSHAIDVTANNLANVNTTGFKASRTNFEDLLYQARAQPGVENANGEQAPAGLFVGLGTRISNTQFDFTTGSPVATGGDLDLMIDGQGLFQVKLAGDQANGIGYTRAGNFFPNANGQLVLGNSQGPLLEPPITLPKEAQRITIDTTGNVLAYVPSSVDPTNVGRIQLATFVNPAGLNPVGGNIYTDTPASGPPIQGFPTEGNFGPLKQGYLESSNVDPVKELVNLIKTQRAFEMNSQTIQAANQTLQVVSNMMRF